MNQLRKLTKTGNSRSMSVVIPAEFIKSLGWKDRQRVLLKKVKGKIIIQDAKTKK